jgi:hypothetical protein
VQLFGSEIMCVLDCCTEDVRHCKSNRFEDMDNFLIYILELPLFRRRNSDSFTKEHELIEWIISIFSVTHKVSFYVLFKGA